MRTVKAIIGSSALVMVMAASPAIAASRDHMLRGDFAFSGTAVCVNAPAFNANLAPNPQSSGSVSSYSVQGVRTFNGNGTGSVIFRVVSFGEGSSGPGPVTALDATASFRYAILANGRFTIDQGATSGTFLTGPNTGEQSTVSGVPTFVGFLSADRNSFTSSTYLPGVETVTRLDAAGTAVLGQSQRVCHRARTGIRISNRPGSGGRDED